MIPVPSPDSSPHPPPPPRIGGAFTAVLIPLGAIAAIILLFALWTTDHLLIPGLGHKTAGTDVRLFGVRLGAAGDRDAIIWGIGIVTVFALAGGGLGFLAGKGLDRLSRWGT
jgi:hypothetical protein